MPDDRLIQLVRSLLKLEGETEWFELKQNNTNPEKIGEYTSALSNSAALCQKNFGYVIWGVADGTHAIVGTTFKPGEERINQQELESWVVNQLSPRLHIKFNEVEIDGKPVVVLEIPAASHTPVRFRDTEFVRVGTYTKKLKEYPEKERTLWKLFEDLQFEDRIALADVDSGDVLKLLDYPAFFELTGQPLPSAPNAINDRLNEDGLVVQRGDDRVDITNLGAVLFARDLKSFDRLWRKKLRIILYDGKGRVKTIREREIPQGYAVGFQEAVRYIDDQLPVREKIGVALRREERAYPTIAVRELVANCLIHQDFSLTGTGPVVEIFSDRIEITNPGAPLIDPTRFVDHAPRSRNERLAALMRRMNFCEERGSGIDKVITAVEDARLPPPDFRSSDGATVATLYAYKPLNSLTPSERIRACYQHACLRYVMNERLTNASLRERLDIEEKNYPVAWRVINDAVKANLIKPYNPSSTSKKHASYVPVWA